jgi:hypothetical protein
VTRPQPRSLVSRARAAKHRGLLAVRSARARRVAAEDKVHQCLSALRPFTYSADDHTASFISSTPEGDDGARLPVPRQMFVLWTGTNKMSENRRAALTELREHNPHLDVRLVGPADLESLVVPGADLHPAYDDLSLVHRADYLRAYLLHHHGGIYCDLKRGYGDLTACLQTLDDRADLWLVGYRELSASLVAQVPGATGRSLRRHHRRLAANGAYAARPGTPLTSEWLSEVEHRLDHHRESLRRHPGDVRGTSAGYPVGWSELLGEVFQPLQLKYLDRVALDDRLSPSLVDFT